MLLGLVAVAGCRTTRAHPVVEKPAPVGAVPIPGTYESKDASNNHVDRTVSIDALPALGAAWHEHATLAYHGQVAVALHIATHEFLELAVVDTETATETGYPGTLETFRLASVDTNDSPEGGNAYSARDVDQETGAYVGPIMFAVRVLPKPHAPEDERRQFAVYTDGHTILVADKRLSESRWTPQLRIDAPDASEVVAINSGWH